LRQIVYILYHIFFVVSILELNFARVNIRQYKDPPLIFDQNHTLQIWSLLSGFSINRFNCFRLSASGSPVRSVRTSRGIAAGTIRERAMNIE